MGVPRPNHQAERGAAVFIVVMVLALVTALGIFAVRSASLAEVAAGYDREAAQTSLLAQYATSTSAAFVSGPGGFALTHMKSSTDCLSSKGMSVHCLKLGYEQMNDPTFSSTIGQLLGPAASPTLNAQNLTTGDFLVELTEGNPTGIPRPGGGPDPVTVTLTVTAQVRPTGAVCTTPLSSNAGQQVVRALITR